MAVAAIFPRMKAVASESSMICLVYFPLIGKKSSRVDYLHGEFLFVYAVISHMCGRVAIGWCQAYSTNLSIYALRFICWTKSAAITIFGEREEALDSNALQESRLDHVFMC